MRLLQITGFLLICLAFIVEQMSAVDEILNDRGLRENTCRNLAKQLTTRESNQKDINFFKRCIVDYFSFRVGPRMIYTIPTINLRQFFNPKGPAYIKTIAKRIERFFIRNGNWDKILKNKDIYDREENCLNLLYITAAKYAYALYVLNTLTNRLGCLPCIKRNNIYSLRSFSGVCFIKPKDLTCGGILELSLLGHKSGSLTTLFNQFFTEPIGQDRTVPGFKKEPAILMGLRISAFSLEKVLPKLFRGPSYFYNLMLTNAVKKMKENIQMKMLSVAVAIFRMKPYSGKFFNELLSDQSPLRAQIYLAKAFQYWSVELALFASKIKSFMKSPHYSYELNYRRRHNIAYELITGRLENRGLPPDWISNLAEHAICLIYNVPAYLTPGAVHHSVIMEMYSSDRRIVNTYAPDVEGYWQSMLENWAIANRVYWKECVENKLLIRPCLLRMSKSLHLMLDAMTKSRLKLKKIKRAIGGEIMVDFKDVAEITKSWVKNYRDKGHFRLPTVKSSCGRVKPHLVRKRPFFMTSQSHDDFPELRDSEKKLPRELVNITRRKQLDEHIRGSAELETGNLERLREDEPLDENIEGSINGNVNRVKKPLDNAGITGMEKNGLLNENTEGSHQTKPLDEVLNDFDDSDAMKLLTVDAANGLRNDIDESREIKPLDRISKPGGSQEGKNYDDEQNLSGVYETSPLTPDILDLDEDEKSLTRTTQSEVRPVYVTLEAPAEPPVSRMLSDDDMERPLDEKEKTADASIAESDSEKTTDSTMETLPENADSEKTTDSTMGTLQENADMSMTKPHDINNEEMSADDDIQETKDSAMTEHVDKDTKKTVRLQTMKPLDKDIKHTVGSTMAEQLDRDTTETGGIQTTDKDFEETVGSQITKPLDKETKETVGSPTTKPLDKDTKETVGSPTTKPLDKETKVTIGSPTTKPLDKETKETVGSPTTKPLDKETKETVGSPTTKPLDKETKETIGSPATKPLDKETKETVGSPTTKPLDKETKETVDAPATKPLDKETKGSPTKPLDKQTDGSPTTKPLDSKVTFGSTISKSLKGNVKKTTDTEIEDELQEDDFPEHPATEVPFILEKTEQKKLGTLKKQPKFVSFFRRRRFGSRAFSRRRYRIYVSRRRRSGSFTRRRRSSFTRRKGVRVKGKKTSSSCKRLPDETKNIRKFLMKFNCHVGVEISKMALTEGCMNKIQSHVRSYNRYAFSYIAKKHRHSRPTSSDAEADDVLLKTEL
ncbi:uncharacterized protein LOC114523107 isoform X2 [Dendronephthya gigantea]|uniref:uncharacterized protein LOC114523107 isoform X2 n=1 Tax=Dendronephthya gigantea TaxID=151771 RepID=UPI0010694EE0|nr:uncharacterized protein LOC114523107 isoform X2 [Dendronephthya gigantea]